MLFKSDNSVKVLNENTYDWIENNDRKWDLVILDPIFNDIKINETFMKKVENLLSDNGQLVFFIDWKNLNRVMNATNQTNLHHLNYITWARMSPGHKKSHYKTGQEIILWYCKNKNNYIFNKQFRKKVGKSVLPYKNKDGSPRGWFYDETTGERTQWAEVDNFWCYTRPTWSSEEITPHGMQKPLQLSDRIILTATNEKDNILDLFSGSGSFAVSAKRLNRNYLGIELNPKWYDLIQNRIKKAFELKY